MLKLVQFKPALGVHNPSPPCLKLEIFLKMADIPYEVKYSLDPRKAPKGKIPYIIDGDLKMGDSSLIIEYLTKKYNVQIDDWLSLEQKATGYAFTKLFDEYLYWCGVYSRWIDEECWPAYKEAFFGRLPFLPKLFVPNMVRKNMQKQLWGHGLGRHTRDEIYQIGHTAFEHISNFIGNKEFFFGDKVSSFDAGAFAILCNFTDIAIDSELKRSALRFNNLKRYVDRMKSKYL